MRITNVGYSQFVQNRVNRNIVRIELNDGSLLWRRITGSTAIDALIEEITFSANWASTIQPEDIRRVDIVSHVRSASDTITIEHQNNLGHARINMPVVEVFDS